MTTKDTARFAAVLLGIIVIGSIVGVGAANLLLALKSKEPTASGREPGAGILLDGKREKEPSGRPNRPTRTQPLEPEEEEEPVLKPTERERLAGSRLVVGLRRGFDKRLEAALRDGLIAGVILMSPDLDSVSQVQELTKRIRLAAEEGGQPVPIICCDVEGGEVNRTKDLQGAPIFPSASVIRTLGPAKRERMFADMAVFLATLGINVNLAPVVDLGTSPKAMIYSRSYGKDAEKILPIARAFVDEMERANVGAVLKHYPGHGLTTQDSHHGLIRVKSDAKEVMRHREPFLKLAIEGKAKAAMLSHLLVEAIDDRLPISISSKGVKAARVDMGDQVILWTDSGAMSSLNAYTDAQAAALALESGVDIYLTTKSLQQLGGSFFKQLASGLKSEKALSEGSRRVQGYRKTLR